MDSWIAEAVGTMHINKITQKAVARKWDVQLTISR